MTIKRLSPYNIQHPLHRAKLYQEITTASSDDIEYEVSINETDKPELIASRLHGTTDSKLLVAVSAGLASTRETLSPAQVIRVKQTPVLRKAIRKYQDMETTLEALNDDF